MSTVDEIREKVIRIREDERAKYEHNKPFPPLTPEQTRLQGRLVEEPPPHDVILTIYNQPFLTSECVGAILGAGGISKSYFAMQLAFEMARGGRIGPIKAEREFTVLYLAGEDQANEIERRMWRISGGPDFPGKLYAASVAGKLDPFLRVRGGGLEVTESFSWLRETLRNHDRLDVLILDPKSKFFGAVENDPDHNTRWINLLESLVADFKITVLFTHHVSKASTREDLSATMARGASSLIDGCRWALGMCPMSEKIGERYAVNHRDYATFDLVKRNYVPPIAAPFHLKRGEFGILSYEKLESLRTDEIARSLVSILSVSASEFTRRQLVKEREAKHIADELKAQFEGFTRRRDMDAALDHALEKGWVEEVTVQAGKRTAEILRVVSHPEVTL